MLLGRGENLTALDIVALRAAEQSADVVACLALIEQLAEHFDAGDRCVFTVGRDTDDFDFVADLDDTALHTAGDHGAAAGDGERVFDRASGRACRLRATRIRECSCRKRPAARGTHSGGSWGISTVGFREPSERSRGRPGFRRRGSRRSSAARGLPFRRVRAVRGRRRGRTCS